MEHLFSHRKRVPRVPKSIVETLKLQQPLPLDQTEHLHENLSRVQSRKHLRKQQLEK